MRRLLPALAACLLGTCALAAPPLPGTAFRRPHWDAPEATVRGRARAETPFRLGLDTGLWFSNWSVRADTASGTHKTASGPAVFIAPRLDMDFGRDWSAALRLEIGQASDFDTMALAFRFERPVYDAGDGVVRLHAGPAIASLDAHRFPGHFRDAVGFDVGGDFQAPLTRGWTLRADATLRYMKFEYSRDATVTSANDHSAGPIGVLLSVGATYDF